MTVVILLEERLDKVGISIVQSYHRAMVQQKDSNYFSDARRQINFGVPVVKGGQNIHPWLE